VLQSHFLFLHACHQVQNIQLQSLFAFPQVKSHPKKEILSWTVIENFHMVHYFCSKHCVIKISKSSIKIKILLKRVVTPFHHPLNTRSYFVKTPIHQSLLPLLTKKCKSVLRIRTIFDQIWLQKTSGFQSWPK
jgi:hypothetical protein